MVSHSICSSPYIRYLRNKKMGRIIFFGFWIVLFTTSCSPRSGNEVVTNEDNLSVTSTQYAKRFHFQPTATGYQLNVYNPWQGAEDISYSYRLDSTISKPVMGEEVTIPIPLKKVVCLSTTHLSFIDRLDELDAIVGVSGINLTSNKKIHNAYNQGSVVDVGYEQSLNHERIVVLSPDVVFAYGVGAEMTGYTQRLVDLGIPVVYIADYLENSPLGKAEWLKAFGLFFNQPEKADMLFSEIERSYNELKSVVQEEEQKPTVFLNLPWKDIWYLPGNDGFMAQYIRDAGGIYIMEHLSGSNSTPFSLEAVLSYVLKADIWINTGVAVNLDEILMELPLAKDFPAFLQGRIYNNNRRMESRGGNDFWESGVVNPHLILRDLVTIFYPHLYEYPLTYYQKLE